MIEHIVIEDVDLYIAPISHSDASRREREMCAVKELLGYALGADAELSHDENGAPKIKDYDVKISISHSVDYACVALSKTSTIGVDIEQPRMQLQRVASRVFSADEVAVYGSSLDSLLLGWTLKEAVYKAALTPGLDFRADIALPLSGEDTAQIGNRQFKILKTIHDSEYIISLVKAV